MERRNMFRGKGKSERRRLVEEKRGTEMTGSVLSGLVVLLFFLPGGQTVDKSKAIDSARQMATSADAGALSVEERQAELKKLEQTLSLLLSQNDQLNVARVLNRIGRLQLILDEPQIALN